MITGKRVLVTGASGTFGSALAAALAPQNDVWGVARFTDPGSADRIAAAGVQPVVADLGALDAAELLEVLPDVDHVLHLAVDMFGEPDFERAHRNNVEPGGLLLARYRDVESFLYCSSTAVYEAHPQPRRETDPLGDYMRRMIPTYSISKIAGEAVARTCSRLFEVPVTIARLNLPYADTAGLPTMHLHSILAGEPVVVHPDLPDVFAPIHVDDMVRTLPALLGAASTPPTIVNWCGDEPVGIAEWSAYLGELVGREVVLQGSEAAMAGMSPDASRLAELLGGRICTVGWREGFRRMVDAVTAPTGRAS